VKLLAGQFTPWVGPVSLFGIVTVWRKDKSRCAFLAAFFLVVSLASILIPNFDLDRMSIWLNTTYWIPAYVVVAFFIGFGVDRIATRLGQGRWRKRVTAVLGLVCVVSPFLANYARCNKNDYYFARDYALNVLRTMDEGAVYYPLPDHSIFPVVYLQIVEGLRPDVTVANKYGFPEPHLYADMPEVMKNRFGRYPNALQRRQIQRWIVRRTDRSVYFARKPSLGSLPGKTIVNAGLLCRVVATRASNPAWDGWDGYEWHTLDQSRTHGDWTADLILYDYHFARGRWLLDRGRSDEGVQAFERALAIAGEDKEWLNDVASACAEYGLNEASATYFRRALAQDPGYQLALRNLARVYMRTGRCEQAIPLLEKSLKAHPNDVAAYWLLSRCLLRVGRVDAAIARLETVMALTPYDPRLFRQLGMYYWKRKQDPVRAQELFARSLSLDPDQPDVMAAVDTLGRAGR
jgi:Tfp pilus assembly protein PilF